MLGYFDTLMKSSRNYLFSITFYRELFRGSGDYLIQTTGYSGTGHGASGCAEVDECITGLHECDAFANCANTEGSYDCTCLTGYTSVNNPPGRNGDCIDADECTDGKLVRTNSSYFVKFHLEIFV